MKTTINERGELFDEMTEEDYKWWLGISIDKEIKRIEVENERD